MIAIAPSETLIKRLRVRALNDIRDNGLDRAATCSAEQILTACHMAARGFREFDDALPEGVKRLALDSVTALGICRGNIPVQGANPSWTRIMAMTAFAGLIRQVDDYVTSQAQRQPDDHDHNFALRLGFWACAVPDCFGYVLPGQPENPHPAADMEQRKAYREMLSTALGQAIRTHIQSYGSAETAVTTEIQRRFSEYGRV